MQLVTRHAVDMHSPRIDACGPRVLFVSSYTPRKCGIATFTEDLRDAYDALAGANSAVIAINEPNGRHRYPSFVTEQIDRDDAASYRAAARYANASGADVVNIQHEYGLFGGRRGSLLSEFLRELRVPAVITLHTTITDPDVETVWV
ncbi:MAG TPA: hypothetical protein VEJ20_03955, partial [Candidatus Eremiobacteraceae bacterium]|nr:hypothetical protein [Candidatus Eremiobacteraceae bacterium]